MILPEQSHGWAAEQKTFAHTRERTAALASSDDLVGELRQFLQSKVPAYMVPSTFMLLESLPLTANGKVNRSALPDPEVEPQQQQAVAFVAPQTELEQTLAAIAQEVLQVEPVGIHSSFFDLGGTSVHMVQMIGKLRDALGREVPVTELFRHPTIHALAEYLSQSQAEPPSFEKSDKRADLRRAAMSRRSAQRQERGKRA
jgi:acyl carrier protein